MAKFILILFILFIIGFSYGFFVKSFSKWKIFAFLPSIVGTIFLIYIKSFSPSKYIPGQESVQAIETLFNEFFIVSLVIGNLLGYRIRPDL